MAGLAEGETCKRVCLATFATRACTKVHERSLAELRQDELLEDETARW
jgi:hypothetical protein